MATLIKKYYFVNVETYAKGKYIEADSGMLDGCFYDKKFLISAIRRKAVAFFNELKSKGVKARLSSSFNDELILKGDCRVYYKGKMGDCYTQFRVLELPLITPRNEVISGFFDKQEIKC